jgi:hypothetical protein
MARDWLTRALTGVVLGGLLVGCSGGVVPTGTNGAPTGQAITGCGSQTVTIPLGDPVPSPACSSGLMTTPSPFPVSEASAIAAGEQFTGRAGLEVLSLGSGRPAYLLSGEGSAVVVDGTTGRVLQFFVLAAPVGLPDGQVPGWSPAPAADVVRDAATAIEVGRAWLAKHGLTAVAGNERAVFDTVPGANAWTVYLAPDGAHQVTVRVSVAGAVVGYQVGDTQLPLALPRIERDAAISLAVARAVHLTGRGEEQVIDAEFFGFLGPERQVAEWMVTTGIPAPDASSGDIVWSLGTAIRVDAVSGEVTVEKAP